MEFPFRPPYCRKSILSFMKSISHITTKDSVTLLKNGVNDIGRRSSSDSGIGTFPIGTTCSSFHWLGHSPVVEILFINLPTGLASSGPNSWIICLGRSFGTPDLGFLAALSFLYASKSLISGGLSVDCSLVCIHGLEDLRHLVGEIHN